MLQSAKWVWEGSFGFGGSYRGRLTGWIRAYPGLANAGAAFLDGWLAPMPQACGSQKEGLSLHCCKHSGAPFPASLAYISMGPHEVQAGGGRGTGAAQADPTLTSAPAPA